MDHLQFNEQTKQATNNNNNIGQLNGQIEMTKDFTPIAEAESGGAEKRSEEKRTLNKSLTCKVTIAITIKIKVRVEAKSETLVFSFRFFSNKDMAIPAGNTKVI